MRITTDAALPLVQSPLLERVPGVWHAFTTRKGGVGEGAFATFNLSMRVGDEPEAVRINRERLAAAAGVEPSLLRLHTQVHGAGVVEVRDGLPAGPLIGDAFVTDRPGTPLLVGVADCAPVLLAAEDGSVVAAVHAGWRGAAAGVVRAAVGMLRERYGVPPSRLLAAIGPSIGPCCFEVGPEVAAHFDAKHVVTHTAECPHVDLPGSLADDLRAAGLSSERIDVANLCTCCRPDLFFSHRHTAGHTGRMVGIILRRPAPGASHFS